MSDANASDLNRAPSPDPGDRLHAVAEAVTHDPQFADLQARAGVRAADVEDLVAEVAARLRGVCAHLDDDHFAALVLDIARTKVRFASRDLSMGLPVFGRNPSGRN
jgi:hypothetical protein